MLLVIPPPLHTSIQRKSDGRTLTCGNEMTILQKKTVWYIIIRAFREKLRAYARLGANPPVARKGGMSAAPEGFFAVYAFWKAL